MQRIAILGSTGSIGKNALDVISRFPDKFKVSFLSAHSNIELLSEQVKRFKPEGVSVVSKEKARQFKKLSRNKKLKIYEGEEGLCGMLKREKIDIVLVAIVGSSALLPILAALDNIKRIALANKEALVMAGDIIMKKAKKNNVSILPVDSEHSAIFQCITSNNGSEIKKIYLTSSGGPLQHTAKKDFKNITPKEAVNHPKWKMGKKISIDSATMMNKGLEVIEAHHLFGVGIDSIDVLIHPETLIHSMVEFVDGAMLAHMGECDMRMPIQYAITYPSRFVSPVKGIEFSKLKSVHFYPPDFKKFPCLRIAYDVAKKGGTHTCILNASNEIAVEEFLKGRINFIDIPRAVEKALELHKGIKNPSLNDILESDRWARVKTKEILDGFSR